MYKLHTCRGIKSPPQSINCDIIPNLQPLKDWHLAVIVLIFVIVDLIILITVTAINRVRYTARTIVDPENPTIVNVRTILVDTLCKYAFRLLAVAVHAIRMV